MWPALRAIISGATARQTRMPDIRLRLRTASTSGSDTKTASFGSGLPAWGAPVPPAPISPPAAWTSMSIWPKAAWISPTTRSTVSGWREVTVDSQRLDSSSSLAISSATAASESASSNARVEVGVVPCTTTRAPRLARCAAMTRPNPRDDPVTQATRPRNSPFVAGHQAVTRPAGVDAVGG